MSATAPSPNDLTRQQLDELDALLQRMLSLPLSNTPAAAPVPGVQPSPSVTLPAGWRTDVPTPGAARSPFAAEVAEELEERVAAMAVPLAAAAGSVRSFTLAPEPPAVGPLRGVDAPALPAGFRAPTAPTPPPAPVEPFADSAPVPLTPAPDADAGPRGRVPVPLWPVFAVNWVMELLLGLLGPVGAVLVHPAVKHLLGAAGLALLAGAAAWAARGLGWVAW